MVSSNFQSVEYFREKIEKRAHGTFKAEAGSPQLQVYRLLVSEIKGKPKRFEVVKNQDVENISQIKELEKADDRFQFFMIRQDRSWTTLDISRELVEEFTSVYDIFLPFWRVVFTFGRKYLENEFEFPRFRSLHTRVSDAVNVQESTYVIRRVQLHNRELVEGQSPWSIRQTGVYQRLIYDSNWSDLTSSTNKYSKSTFLLIAPSESIESQISECMERVNSHRGDALSPWIVHLLLIAESQEGWMDYMAWLEKGLKQQSNRIALTQVGDESESDDQSPSIDFSIEIFDRQKLKLVEDSVIELQIILSTMLNTIARIRKNCRGSCTIYHVEEDKCGCERIIEEFGEYTQEIEMHIERAHSLRERVRSTIQLLSDLLNYEDAAALKDIARQSRQESESMHALTEQSTKDAAAVKVLTIIGLIYLPTTIVMNFFSTEFVSAADNGSMKVSHQTWLLFVLAVPLTLFTIGIWRAWLHCKSLQDSLRKHRSSKFWFWTSPRLIFSSKNRKLQRDVESRELSSESAVRQNFLSRSVHSAAADAASTSMMASKPG